MQRSLWYRAVLFAALAPVACLAQKVFQPACTAPAYPSPPPAQEPAIDALCGPAGGGGIEAAQNTVKNNFCATGVPQPITIPDLEKLQTAAASNPAIDFGDENSGSRKKGPQVDRTPLQALGEGKMVVLTAYVLFARQEGAESVNCESNVPNQAAYHDIHIELIDSPTATDECSGVVAEMIPHHRPDSWKAGDVEKLGNAKPKPMVRVTGQLFFDSSHFPCDNGQGVRSNPKRISLWEIHPIYRLEVCSTGTCAADGEWLALDEWVKSNSKTKAEPATSQQ